MRLKTLNDTRRFIQSIADLQDSKLGRAIFYELDTVDSKTSSLLTHISIMMAVLSVFYSFSKGSVVVRAMLLVELLVYLGATLGCLRSISMFGPVVAESKADKGEDMRTEAVYSRIRSYQMSLVVAAGGTIAFMLTVAIDFLGGFIG